MQLFVIGECLKNLDKVTHNSLLSRYPEIEWREVKGMRDVIGHHYFQLDAEIVFDICQSEIEPLRPLQKNKYPFPKLFAMAQAISLDTFYFEIA